MVQQLAHCGMDARVPRLAAIDFPGLKVDAAVGLIPNRLTDLTLYTGAGVVYGILIEFLATRVFNAPMRVGGAAPAAPGHATA